MTPRERLSLNGPYQRPPRKWGPEIQETFWRAVNAPVYEGAVEATLALVHELAEKIRNDEPLRYHCPSGCCDPTGPAADLIDPEATE